MLGEGDGQWPVYTPAVPAGGTVYSFGVGCDISFDLDVIQRLGASVHAFDPTPISQAWIRQQRTPPAFSFHPFGVGGTDGQVQFALPVRHEISFTTVRQRSRKALAWGQVYRLPTILGRLEHPYVDVVKMDIEGEEYSVIDDIIAHRDRFGQVLIEFHHRLLPWPWGHRSTIEAVRRLETAGLRLFHVTPRGLEYAFIREALL
jgi:FkbM family methyltransferase